MSIFTDSEIKLLNSIVAEFSRRAKHAYVQSFDEFMEEWYTFIKEVEQGYELTIDDYTNDLTKRDLIDRMIARVPEVLKNKINVLVDPWDKRFDTATHVLKHPVFREDNPSWWWYRIPNKLKGELKEDVEALNIN